MALAARPDLVLQRLAIAEPARYYHEHRTIVVRRGLLITEERRYLWHELVHADRGDRACSAGLKVEASVEREAARRAMPLHSLEWATTRSASLCELADVLKLPESWVRFRLDIMHPAERAILDQVRSLAHEESA